MVYPKIQVLPKTGDEQFIFGNETLSFSLVDFWKWSASDLISNTMRGVLAEFIISKALGIESPFTREEWAPWDLTTPEGIKVEVKSASYIQSWHQEHLSKISFLTPKTRAWDPNTNQQSSEIQRQADVYIFALLGHQDQQTINPLDISQWSFWVVPTPVLDARQRSQHSITLPSLISLAGKGLTFDSIRGTVLGCIAQSA